MIVFARSILAVSILLMIIDSEYIENISLQFAESSELLIDTEVPDSIFFGFSDLEVYILMVSTEDKYFRLLILFIELPFDEIFPSLTSYQYLCDFYHIRS